MNALLMKITPGSVSRRLRGRGPRILICFLGILAGVRKRLMANVPTVSNIVTKTTSVRGFKITRTVLVPMNVITGHTATPKACVLPPNI